MSNILDTTDIVNAIITIEKDCEQEDGFGKYQILIIKNSIIE